MPQVALKVLSPSGKNVADDALEKLQRMIFLGVYPPGLRLPPEPVLVDELGTSRIGLRDAIKRLVEMGMVEVRHGSGMTVLPESQWRFGVMAGYLSNAITTGAAEEVLSLAQQFLELRKILLGELLRICVEHLPAGTKLDAARAALEHAWALREQSYLVAIADLDVYRSILLAAGRRPALWLFNSLTAPYLCVVTQLAAHLPVLDDVYRDGTLRIIDALEKRSLDEAQEALERFLGDEDKRLMERMKLVAAAGGAKK